MKKWPHAPTHLFNEKGTYMVTGATLHKKLIFKDPKELDLLENSIIELADKYKWGLKAWVVFPNHYHFIADSPDNPQSLRKFLTHLHANSAREVNKIQNSAGRTVWHQFWDTHLSYQSSYLARLHYIMKNPLKHGVVCEFERYKWCSAQWFETTAEKSFYKSVLNTKIDDVNIEDDFDWI